MVSTEDKLITIDDFVSTDHHEKEKGERIMVYLKERCDCGGRYVDFVEKYCEGGETMSALVCKLCGGKVVIDDYSLNEAAPFEGQCEDCGEPHLFPAEDVWPVVVEMAIAKEVK